MAGLRSWQTSLDILRRVKRFQGRLSPQTEFPIEVLHILYLDVGRIGQHQGGEVGRRGGRVDFAGEALFDQGGDVAEWSRWA